MRSLTTSVVLALVVASGGRAQAATPPPALEIDAIAALRGARITIQPGLQPQTSPWTVGIRAAVRQPLADIASMVLVRTDANCGWVGGERLNIDGQQYWVVELRGPVLVRSITDRYLNDGFYVFSDFDGEESMFGAGRPPGDPCEGPSS